MSRQCHIFKRDDLLEVFLPVEHDPLQTAIFGYGWGRQGGAVKFGNNGRNLPHGCWVYSAGINQLVQHPVCRKSFHLYGIIDYRSGSIKCRSGRSLTQFHHPFIYIGTETPVETDLLVAVKSSAVEG